VEDPRLWRVGDATGDSTAVELGGLGAPADVRPCRSTEQAQG